MTNKHAELPWTANRADGKFISNEPYRLDAEDEGTTSSAIKDASGRVVCIVPEIHDGSFEEGERHLHLRTIVAAVNYHDRLLEALSDTQKLLDNMQEHACACNFYISEDHMCDVCIHANNNRALLAEIYNLEK